MKKVILFILFFVFSNCAMADWKYVTGIKLFTGGELYVDPTTISNTKDFKTIVEKFEVTPNHYVKDHLHYQSVIAKMEFDCKKNTYRILDVTYFAGPELSGSIVYHTERPDQWSPVNFDTFASAGESIVCFTN
jgi:Surface-adhesin protein E